MKPNLLVIIAAFMLSVVLTGCSSPLTGDHHPPVVAPTPLTTEAPIPQPTDQARETGEIVGKEVRDRWELMTEFGRAFWHTITDNRE